MAALIGTCRAIANMFPESPLMLNPAAIPPKTRKHLSFDPLIRQIRLRAKLLPDARNGADCTYSVADAVMSGVAMFTLKEPSLLAFQERRNDVNMKNIFRILSSPQRYADARDTRFARPRFATADVQRCPARVATR